MPLEPSLCRGFFLTSVAVTGEVPPKALHSRIQRLCVAGSADLRKYICKEDPQCVIFSG